MKGWIKMNDHLKRKYLNDDLFIDCETIRGLQEYGYKYVLYKSGGSEENDYGFKTARFIKGGDTLGALNMNL